MIWGMGIDLIETRRIRKELEKSDERFCEMIFTENEIRTCKKRTNISVQAQCFSGRFAVKEAFFKAIGTGLRHGLRWKDVEVLNDSLGKPMLVLHNRALEIIRERGISNIQCSISHDRLMTTAIVVLETGT